MAFAVAGEGLFDLSFGVDVEFVDDFSCSFSLGGFVAEWRTASISSPSRRLSGWFSYQCLPFSIMVQAFSNREVISVMTSSWEVMVTISPWMAVMVVDRSGSVCLM